MRADRIAAIGPSIFARMSALAIETNSINLGQGFPDVDGPIEVKQSAIDSITAGHNQYPPVVGVADLRSAISNHQKRFYELDFDPDTEIVVTTGATEAIAAALLAFCNPGDEVITFEPYYDAYAACIELAQGKRRTITLNAPDYSFDPEQLNQAVNSRTRMILLNSPHNPTGKVFSREELNLIAEIAIKHDLLVVTDEVYEHLVFVGEHIPIATLDGMRHRTLTISSGGKTFSYTGWKVGWACGDQELVDSVKSTKQFLTFATGTPFQHAIATGLQLPDSYFERFTADMEGKRDRLCNGMRAIGLDVLEPQGTYFATVDVSNFGTDGITFCESLPSTCGVVAIPTAPFYDNPGGGHSLVRFAFCKKDELLDEALRRLARLRDGSVTEK